MFLAPSCSCLCPIHWSQVLSWESRCSWSSADRRCSNYIWVINNFVACYGASYIRGFTVLSLLSGFKWCIYLYHWVCFRPELRVKCVHAYFIECTVHQFSQLSFMQYMGLCVFSLPIFSCDQAALRTLISVCPFVCPSVHLSHLFDNVPVIVSSWNFQELLPLTDTMSTQSSRSKVKVTEVMTPFSRFQTVTPVLIHIWWWNDAQSFVCLEEVPYCSSRSSVKFQGHTANKIVDFYPNWVFPDCNSSLNSPLAMKNENDAQRLKQHRGGTLMFF